MRPLNKKNKIIIAGVAVTLVLTSVIGVSLALLKDKSEPKENTFKGSVVNIGVMEKDKLIESGTLDFPQFSANSKQVEKSVKIKNISSEEYPTHDTYVRVRLVPVFRYTDADKEHAGQTVAADTSKVSYGYGDQKAWKQTGTGSEIYYYYMNRLTPGSTTEELIKSVNYEGEIPENAALELQVLAEGISAKQVSGDGETSAADSAWGVNFYPVEK